MGIAEMVIITFVSTLIVELIKAFMTELVKSVRKLGIQRLMWLKRH